MNTRESSPQQSSPINEKAETSKDSPTDPDVIDFVSLLDDFMDEEVVDMQGVSVGTLACYWQSVSGLLVFLGIKVEGHQSIRIVPGRRSQVDERHACIRLGFDAEDIESAPRLNCATELDATIERSVYEHFGIAEAQPHGGLRYVTRARERDLQSAATIGVEETDETRGQKPQQENSV
jgi:hypothetical protein